MSYLETALRVPCGSESLAAIVAEPARTGGDIGVLIIVGGPQYRAGSHRLFVKLARELAGAGVPAMRFDMRGMGDSTGESVPHFESADPDIAAAIDAFFQRCTQLRRVVLWGLCDGASAALLHADARADDRIAGFCLVNPWVRSAASQARTNVKHYYGKRLMQRDFWLKVVRGRLSLDALAGLWRSVWAARQKPVGQEIANFQGRMLRGWLRRPLPTLLVLSGEDFTAREFEEYATQSADWTSALQRKGVRRLDLPGADHTLSDLAHQGAMAQEMLRWIAENAASRVHQDVQRIPADSEC